MEVNGTALRYDLTADVTGASASTLVLIHEMGGTLESWDAALPLLAGRRRALRYDTRGAGLSQKIR
jgi:pimeloyl-ACP methyl ester carboxylesterase